MTTEALKSLETAVEQAGGQAELARKLSTDGRKISQQRIWNWLNRDGKAPAELVLAIESVTGVSRYQLRGDVFSLPERIER